MQRKQNYFTDNEDIQFHFHNKFDWQLLYDLSDQEELEAIGADSVESYKATWHDVLTTLGELIGSEIAPNAEKVEQEPLTLLENGDVQLGPTLQSNIQKLLEFGTAGMAIHPRFGGMGAPFIVELLGSEMLYRACPSTDLNMVWYSSVAHVIELFGSDQQKETYIPRIAAGEWSGSMALTEAGAGSDLSAITTYGVCDQQGQWRLYGSKRFISNGCGDFSLVLAKKEKGAPSLNDLNLYLVRRKIDDKPNYMVTKIEEKIGLHGSATCELQFDGSVAELVGEQGKGFRYMLQLMNDARVAVALQGLGAMDSIYIMAREFAENRKTWGKPIADHELVRSMLETMRTEKLAFRSLCYQAVFYRSVIYLAEKKLHGSSINDQERQELTSKLQQWRKLMRKWTPLVKWWAGEKTPLYARMNMQIHGGYGFTKEYRAEWWLRESMILPIYEGTSQIQALMCIKDVIKDALRKPSDFAEIALGYRLRSLSAGDALLKKLYKCKQEVNGAILSLLYQLVKDNVKDSFSDTSASELLKIVRSFGVSMLKFDNISLAMLHAERVCEMKALVAMGNCLVRDVGLDDQRSADAHRILDRFLLRIKSLREQINEINEP